MQDAAEYHVYGMERVLYSTQVPILCMGIGMWIHIHREEEARQYCIVLTKTRVDVCTHAREDRSMSM